MARTGGTSKEGVTRAQVRKRENERGGEEEGVRRAGDGRTARRMARNDETDGGREERDARGEGHHSSADATRGCRVCRPPPSPSFTSFPRRPVHPTLHLRRHRACCHPSVSQRRVPVCGAEGPGSFFRPPKKGEIFDALNK